jgi:hypothetical protein
MGREVDLTNPKTGETIPSIISIDKLTMNSLHFVQPSLKSREIKGIKLDDQQKTTLSGKPLYLEGMILKKGEPFNASVQFNADKRYVEFLSIEEIATSKQKSKILKFQKPSRKELILHNLKNLKKNSLCKWIVDKRQRIPRIHHIR